MVNEHTHADTLDRKTTLLKCIAELNVYHAGRVLLHGL